MLSTLPFALRRTMLGAATVTRTLASSFSAPSAMLAQPLRAFSAPAVTAPAPAPTFSLDSLPSKIGRSAFAGTEETKETWVLSLASGELKGIEKISGKVFGQKYREDILHQVVTWQRACRRQGTHATKTLSTINGTGKKPWKQKGTGRARAGTMRQPQMRGGYIVHGPQPRDYSYTLPKQVRRLGMAVALSSKFASGELHIVDGFDAVMESPKSKELLKVLKARGWSDSVYLVGGTTEVPENLSRASRNVPNVLIAPAVGANVYDILRHKNVVITLEALRKIEEKLLETL